jgi:hypothetical protein
MSKIEWGEKGLTFVKAKRKLPRFRKSAFKIPSGRFKVSEGIAPCFYEVFPKEK